MAIGPGKQKEERVQCKAQATEIHSFEQSGVSQNNKLEAILYTQRNRYTPM